MRKPNIGLLAAAKTYSVTTMIAVAWQKKTHNILNKINITVHTTLGYYFSFSCRLCLWLHSSHTFRIVFTQKHIYFGLKDELVEHSSAAGSKFTSA